ncbi:ABC transporter substrate binding protein [Bradyrhizobium shewense]|uniref:ABC transporter substrate binding protein n=1 Tax=Bradyrhizobium shewense TaxID=1761772 RepID=A0A1C3XTZ9_9BRAD|nr:ABC transporter substrate binding protein [Bradyrhizobium shewense]SCB55777.1 ABC transporter substrate binding protein [Bradyrhizobium shewense]
MLSLNSPGSDIEAFDRSLADRGYVFGRNVTKASRWAEGDHDKLAELAKELVSLNPSLIVAPGYVVALAVRRATSTIPIVFIIASDPVKIGLAKSFAHPGGNACAFQTIVITNSRPS